MDHIGTFLREMKVLEGHAAFEHVESKFKFTRCIRQGSVEAPTLWLKQAMQISWNVEEEWSRNRIGVHIGKCQGESHQICSFVRADNYCSMSHSPVRLEQERWDLDPKPASLWWTRVLMRTTKGMNIMFKTQKEMHKFPFEKSFNILNISFIQQVNCSKVWKDWCNVQNKVW